MRYFSYNEYDETDGGCIYTVSEEEIRKQFWPRWYKKMCNKYEQSYVDENYSFEDCLDDWCLLNGAWEVKE